jgi:hypothetical protein
MWAASMKTPDNKDENWWVVLSTPEPINPKDERWTTRLWRKTCEVSISDWLMVLFTAALAYYASSQYAEMHNAGRQTDRIIAADDRLARAMEDSVGQAKKSIDTTVSNFQLDQRAWVGPVSAEPLSIAANSTFTVGVTVTNSGKTPALRMESDFMAHLIPKTKPLIFPYLEQGGDMVRSIDTLEPGMRINLNTVPITLSQQQLDVIKTQQGIFYFYGRVRYEDVFKRGHTTTFCLLLSSDMKGVRSCHTYNAAD